MASENSVVTLNVEVKTDGAASGLAALARTLETFKAELASVNASGLKDLGAANATTELARVRSELKQMKSALDAQSADFKASYDRQAADHKSALEKMTADFVEAKKKEKAIADEAAAHTKQKLAEQKREYELYRASGDTKANLAYYQDPVGPSETLFQRAMIQRKLADKAKVEAEYAALGTVAAEMEEGRSALTAARKVKIAQESLQAKAKLEAEYAALGAAADDISVGRSANVALKRIAAANETKMAVEKMEAEIDQLAAAAAAIQAGRIAKSLMLEEDAAAKKIALARQVQAADIAAWEARGLAQKRAVAQAELMAAADRDLSLKGVSRGFQGTLSPAQAALVRESTTYQRQYNEALAENEKRSAAVANVLPTVTGHTRSHAEAMRDAHSAARGLLGSMGQMWLTWGNIVPLLAGAAIGTAIKQTYDLGRALEYQLTFVKALDENHPDVNLERFSKAVQGSMFGVVESAQGLRALAQAGLDTHAAVAVLPDVLRLATVGELSVAAAALGATGVMHAFNLTIAEMPHVVDVFTKAAAVSNTSVEGMVGAMKQASTVGDFYKVSVEQTAAALATMAKRNIEGTAAGTAFRNMMKEIATPSTLGKQAMEQMGLSAYESGHKLKSFDKILEELSVTVAGLNEESRLNFLNDVFGERGAKAANALLSDLAEYKKILEKLKDPQEAFAAGVEAMLTETTQGKIKRLLNDLELAFNKAFVGSKSSIDSMLMALDNIANSKTFELAVSGITTGVALLTQAIAQNGLALAGTAAALLLYSQSASIAASAVGVATTAWAAYNMVLAMNPIGQVIIAMAILYSGVELLTQGYNYLTNGMNKANREGADYVTQLNKETERIEAQTKALRENAAIKAGKRTEKVSELKAEVSLAQSYFDENPSLTNRNELAQAKKNLKDAEEAEARYKVAMQSSAREALRERYKKEVEDYQNDYEQKKKNKKLSASVDLDRFKFDENSELSLAGGDYAKAISKLKEYKEELNSLAGTYNRPDKKAAALAKAEISEIVQEYNTLYKAYDKDFTHYKALIDQKVKLGGMSQDVAETEVSAFRKETDLLVDAYERQEMSVLKTKIAHSALDAAQKKEAETRLKAIEAKRAEMKVEREHQAQMESEKASLMKRKEGSDTDVALAKFSAGAAIDRAKEQSKFDHRFDSREAIAGEAAYQAVLEKGKSIIEKQTAEVEKAREQQNEYIQKIMETGDASGDWTAKLLIQIGVVQRHEAELAKATRGIEAEAAASRLASITILRAQNTWQSGARAGATSYLHDVENVGAATERIMVNAFKGMEDALVKFVQTGKLDFRSLADSIIADMIRMQVRQNLMGPLAGAMNLGLASMFPSAAATAAVETDAMSSWISVAAANGGVFSSPDLHNYANTIVSSPTLFRFARGGAFGQMGEAGPEAIMPLTRGSDGKLGVQATGSSEPSIVFNQTVNIDSRTDQATIMSMMGVAKNAAISEMADARRRGRALA